METVGVLLPLHRDCTHNHTLLQKKQHQGGHLLDCNRNYTHIHFARLVTAVSAASNRRQRFFPDRRFCSNAQSLECFQLIYNGDEKTNKSHPFSSLEQRVQPRIPQFSLHNDPKRFVVKTGIIREVDLFYTV